MNNYTKAVLAVVACTMITGCTERWEAVSSKQFRTVASTTWPYSTPGDDRVYFEFLTVGVNVDQYSRVTCDNPLGIASEYLPKLFLQEAQLAVHKHNSFAGSITVDHKRMAKHLKIPEIEVMQMSTNELLAKLGGHKNCKGVIDTGVLNAGKHKRQLPL